MTYVRRISHFSGWFVSAAMLVLYIVTLSPGVLGGDAGELQVVPYTGGVAHPTGYPLQVLLNRLWIAIFPLFSVAYRINFLSSLIAALGLFFLHETVLLLTQLRVAACFATVLTGTAEALWSQAISADKYALNFAFVSLLLYLALHCLQSQQSMASPRQALVNTKRSNPNLNLLRFFLFCSGLSLTHHRSMLAVLPGIVGIVLVAYRHELHQPRHYFVLAASMLLPGILYIYLPLAAHNGVALGGWQPNSLAQWIDFLADRGYLQQINLYANLLPNLHGYVLALMQQYDWIGLLLGFLGMVCAFINFPAPVVNQRQFSIILLSIVFINAMFAFSYDVPRRWVFALPSFSVFGIFIGVGIAWVATGVKLVSMPHAAAPVAALIGLVVLGLTRPANYSRFQEARAYGGPLDEWRQDLKFGTQAERFVWMGLPFTEPNAVLAADWEQATAIGYYQQVDNLRTDVKLLTPIDRWYNTIAQNQPVYIARKLSGLSLLPYYPTGVGSLVRIATQPLMQLPHSADLSTPNIAWADKIVMAGYHIAPNRFARVLPLCLYFRAVQLLDKDYAISVRLYDSKGKTIWSQDRQAFVMDMRPTTSWQVGEIIGEYFDIALPTNLPDDDYTVGVVLYFKEDSNFTNLRPDRHMTITNTHPVISDPQILLLQSVRLR